jgi:hypothetical protein
MTGAQTWAGGGGYEWQVAAVNGTAGVAWDVLQISGTLDLAASSGSRFTILVSSVTLDGMFAALPAFDAGQEHQWLIASASGGITGFSEGDFAFDLTGFAHEGVFSVERDGNSLYLNFSPVPEPSAGILAALGGILCGIGYFRRRRATVSPPPLR